MVKLFKEGEQSSCCDQPITRTDNSDSNIKTIDFHFSPKIHLDNNQTKVTLKYKMAFLKNETAINVTARYPTYGFTVNVNHNHSQGKLFDYDGSWFITADPNFKRLPKGDNMFPEDNGIKFITSHWILPGEGILANWIKRSKIIDNDLSKKSIL